VIAVGILLVVAAYLVGTFPTASLVGARRGVDPSRAGSGNPGATNMYRTAGRRAGALVGLGDIAKGVVPTAVALAVDGRGLATLCWLAAVLGHVLPITRLRRGGKGVATAGGGALVLHPLVAGVLIVVFVLVVWRSRFVSLGSVVMAAGLPFGVAATGRPAGEVAGAALIGLLVVVRHADNLRRLRRGEERPIR
jgi:glycerol-3-phosphate acyltransferase PlsY